MLALLTFTRSISSSTVDAIDSGTAEDALPYHRADRRTCISSYAQINPGIQLMLCLGGTGLLALEHSVTEQAVTCSRRMQGNHAAAGRTHSLLPRRLSGQY